MIDRFLNKNIFKISIIFLILFITFFCYQLAIDNPIVNVQKSGFQMIDIAYYFSVVDYFWQNSGADVYQIPVQQKILTAILGRQQYQTMPVNIMPSAFVVLYPFVKIWHYNNRIGYFVWTCFNVQFFAFMVMRFARKINITNPKINFFTILFIVAFITSECFFETIVCGQTSLIAINSLMLLLFCLIANHSNKRLSIQIIICLLFLSIKPQYFALGVISLLIFKRYRLIISAGVIFLSLLAVVFYFGGSELFQSYLWTLQLYSKTSIPIEYTEIFSDRVINRMNMLTVAFSEYLNKGVLKKITLFMFIGVSLLSFFVSLFYFKDKRLANNKVKLFSVYILISGYLLFAPHLGFYEELFLVVISILGLNVFTAVSGVRILFLLFFLCVDLNMHIYTLPITFTWIIKLCFILLLGIEMNRAIQDKSADFAVSI